MITQEDIDCRNAIYKELTGAALPDDIAAQPDWMDKYISAHRIAAEKAVTQILGWPQTADWPALPVGTLVRKKSGAQWHGRIVGYYQTDLTPRGYCVESCYEAGSVQLYPDKALEDWTP